MMKNIIVMEDISNQYQFNESHPSRVRGLKSIKDDKEEGVVFVAPLAGAWIEIINYIIYILNKKCRTLRGCVD